MKVALINTSDSGGGAAEACMRLLKALQQQHVQVTMVVQNKARSEPAVYSVDKTRLDKAHASFTFLYERLPFIAFRAKDRSVRFAFSTADAGTDISSEQPIQEADILHIHWTNSGFLSISDLQKLIALNKPIVWTLHDMWLFTGGCHYAGICNHFKGECGNCYFLSSPAPNDISHIGWLRKSKMLADTSNISFVTCSNWLGDVAKESSILKGANIRAIPNPIDTQLFSPKDKPTIRQKRNIGLDKKIILFGAANIADRRKGLSYLIEALQYLKNYPDVADVEVMIFGKNKRFDTTTLPFPVHQLNVITSPAEMAEIYSLADVFLLPSVEDNLPNTVMEAMACATPVVAFDTGGLPDLVDHQVSGYLAAYKSAADLAAGVNFVLTAHDRLANAARDKVLKDFNFEKVARQYIGVYNSMLEKTQK